MFLYWKVSCYADLQRVLALNVFVCCGGKNWFFIPDASIFLLRLNFSHILCPECPESLKIDGWLLPSPHVWTRTSGTHNKKNQKKLNKKNFLDKCSGWYYWKKQQLLAISLTNRNYTHTKNTNTQPKSEFRSRSSFCVNRVVLISEHLFFYYFGFLSSIKEQQRKGPLPMSKYKK